MLLNDIFTVVLLPVLIGNNSLGLESNQTSTDGDGFHPPQFAESFTEQTFSNFDSWDDFPETEAAEDRHKTTVPVITDPLLQEVNDEVRRLYLEYPDDYFDHLEDGVEDQVKQLVKDRQQQLTTQATRNSKSLKSDEESSSTMVPILIPSITVDPMVSTTKKPGPMQSAVNELKQEAKGIFGKITSPITNARDFLFGKKTTTTTTTSTTEAPHYLENLEMEYPVLNLNCSGYEVEYKGECHNLFQNLQCNKNTEWLVEDTETQVGKCVDNPCYAQTNTANFGGKCVKVSTDTECQDGMRTYLYRSGVVECDCKEGHLYNHRDGRCFKAYTQGPCSTNQHFIIPKISGGATKRLPTCLPNVCLHDGYFCNAPRCPRQRHCERLGSPCGSSLTNPNGTATYTYQIDETSFTPYCNEKDDIERKPEPIIGNVPTLSCAPGSRRDILGNCRTPTTIEFS